MSSKWIHVLKSGIPALEWGSHLRFEKAGSHKGSSIVIRWDDLNCGLIRGDKRGMRGPTLLEHQTSGRYRRQRMAHYDRYDCYWRRAACRLIYSSTLVLRSSRRARYARARVGNMNKYRSAVTIYRFLWMCDRGMSLEWGIFFFLKCYAFVVLLCALVGRRDEIKRGAWGFRWKGKASAR